MRGAEVARSGRLVPTVRPSLRIRANVAEVAVPIPQPEEPEKKSLVDPTVGGISGLPVQSVPKPAGLEIYAEKYPDVVPPRLLQTVTKKPPNRVWQMHVSLYALHILLVPAVFIFWYFQITKVEPSVTEPQRPLKFDFHPETALSKFEDFSLL